MRTGYGQFCPIAKAAEVLAERWTPLIIRNLYVGCHRFSEILEGCPRMSTTLLTKRLRDLERAGLIETHPATRGKRYVLTASGQECAEVVIRMGEWGARWLEVTPADHDPFIALWSWARMTDVTALPPHRVVVRFDVTDRRQERFWLLLQRPRPEVCVRHPGGDEDIVVRTDLATLVDVQSGRRGITEAMSAGAFHVSGDAVLVRQWPSWGGISSYAPLYRTAGGARD